MVISPQNKITLLNVPLEIDNKNQLTFSNITAQYNYFNSIQEKRIYSDITYIRKDNYIVINDNYDNLIKYNYCMYQNYNFSNKWYYAFIDRIEWLSHNSSKVFIKTDIFQSYQFDISYKQSFIEREHITVSDDIVGANLLPEGLEFGEPIENASSSIDGMNHVYVIACSRFSDNESVFTPKISETTIYNGCIINNIASGLWYYVCSADQCLSELKYLDTEGYGENVIAIFTVPAISLLGLGHGISDSNLMDINASFGIWINGLFNSNGRDVNLNPIPSSLDGYTPKNQKLRQYPYCYLGFTPSNGSKQVFRYEDFTNSTPSFKIISELNPNPYIYFIPKNYKGISGQNVNESVIVSGFPSISYHTDYFSNWIAQNQNLVDLNIESTKTNYFINRLSNLSSFGGGFATLNPLGLVGGYLDLLTTSELRHKSFELDIQKINAQVEQHQLLPNSASMGGSNATLLGYGLMNSDIFTRYTIKRQYAERIDKYFDMYGYLTNKVKIPNISNRPNWNYVKTIGLNATALSNSFIPQLDLEEFKNLFNNGITLWHNPNTFLDYSQNNR